MIESQECQAGGGAEARRRVKFSERQGLAGRKISVTPPFRTGGGVFAEGLRGSACRVCADTYNMPARVWCCNRNIV